MTKDDMDTRHAINHALVEIINKAKLNQPYDQMSAEDQGIFRVWTDYLCDTISEFDDPMRAVLWLVITLRRRGRTYTNLRTEWQIDPAGFVQETIRMLELLTTNLKASGDLDNTLPSIRFTDGSSLHYLFERIFSDLFAEHVERMGGLPP